MIVIETIDGQIFEGPSYSHVVRQMHRRSWGHPEWPKVHYKKMVLKRVCDILEIRTPGRLNPREFLNFLEKHYFLRFISRSERSAQ